MLDNEVSIHQGERAIAIKQFQGNWKKENASEIQVMIDGAISSKPIQTAITGIPFLEKEELMQLQQAQDPLLVAVAPARTIFN